MVLRSVPPSADIGSLRMWHVTLTVSGEPQPIDHVRQALERLSHAHPFLLEARYGNDRLDGPGPSSPAAAPRHGHGLTPTGLISRRGGSTRSNMPPPFWQRYLGRVRCLPRSPVPPSRPSTPSH